MTGGGRELEPDKPVAATVTGLLAERELAAGELIAGRYRIERLLGMGGMGLVYLAHDLELDIDVALKLLRPELASRADAFERFRKELLLARQVSSPHVVRIHDLVRHGPSWLISMDYVSGPSLERLLVEQPEFSPERALAITRQLALGLSAAHARNVIHRDLKPANVLIDEHGEARITDFGVARMAGETGITGSGVVIGTPEYLSPEQARAEPLDARSDLYALGLILFEMLTGTLPFRGGTPAEMLVQRIVRDPPPADSVKPGLPSFAVRLCSWLLELRVSRRIATADAVVRAIDSGSLSGMPLSNTRRRGLLAAGLLVLLLGAGGLGLWWRMTPSTPAESAAIAAPLDLLPLPWASANGADHDLASGIRLLLARHLSAASNLRSADALRVDRALTELAYDAVAADRQHQRVLEVSGARLALEGDMSREGEGWTLRLRLVDAHSPEPQWSTSRTIADRASLQAALTDLTRELGRALGTPLVPVDWPDADTLGAIGQVGSDPKLDVAAARALGQRHHRAELWWQLLAYFDRSERNTEAVDLAASARSDLENIDNPSAQRVRAYAELLIGDVAKAETDLDALAKASPRDHPLRLLLARSQAEQGNFSAAIATLRGVVAEDQRNLDAWYALGKYSIQAGDSKTAVDDYLVHAEVLSNRLGDRPMHAAVDHAFGIGYRRLGQLDAAATRLRRAAELRAELGDQRGQATSLRNLSTVLSIQGQFDPASEALTQARTITEALGDNQALADLANARGALEEERGDYRSALDAYRDSLRLRQSLGDERAIGESLNNVGFAYYQLGEFDNAQTYWQQSAATYRKIDDRAGLVHANQSLALAEIARGDWNSARQLLDESQRTAETLQMAEERSISLASLAELDRLQGRIGTALSQSAAALADFRQRNDPRGIAEMQLLQSMTAADIGAWDAAASALAGLDANAVTEQASTLRWQQAAVALGQGQTRQALDTADTAIRHAVEAHSHAAELQARLLKARAAAALGQKNIAMGELQKVKDELIRYASLPLRLRLAETELEIGSSNAEGIYQQARILLSRLPGYGRAFVIHAHGARLSKPGSAAAREALSLATETLRAVRATTPVEHQPALDAYARSLGLGSGATP